MGNIRLLAVDVGSGTQDILLFEDGAVFENMVKMVIPSQTVQVAEEINQATIRGDNLYLGGNLMGGGASTRAIKDHIESGLRVVAAPFPAKTIKDDLNRVKEIGVEISDKMPAGFFQVKMGDLNLETLKQAFNLLRIPLPDKIAVAVQDHGDSKTSESNRRFRFKHWQNFLLNGGRLKDLVYKDPPEYFTRMLAIKMDLPDALIMDTGAAAILGSLEDSQVKEKEKAGALLVNIGNQHTFAAMVKSGIVQGIFEHHTKMLNPQKLKYYLDRFKSGLLTNDEVYNDGGHGCEISAKPDNYNFVGVTGPRRKLADGLGYHFVNPHGDMMLTGCFGLVRGYKLTYLS